MTYSIEVHGKTYRYASFDAAKRAAEAIFQQTRIVVGIEEQKQ